VKKEKNIEANFASSRLMLLPADNNNKAVLNAIYQLTARLLFCTGHEKL